MLAIAVVCAKLHTCSSKHTAYKQVHIHCCINTTRELAMYNMFDEVDTLHCDYLDDDSSLSLDDVQCEEGLQRSAVYNED